MRPQFRAVRLEGLDEPVIPPSVAIHPDVVVRLRLRGAANANECRVAMGESGLFEELARIELNGGDEVPLRGLRDLEELRVSGTDDSVLELIIGSA